MNDLIHPAKRLSNGKVQGCQTVNAHADNKNVEYLRFSEELENYHKLLNDYHSDLYRWLENAKCYEQFVERITKELSQFGLSDWGITLVDKTKLAHAVPNPHGDMQSIFARAFCECDIIMQHSMISDKPICLSDIEAHVRSAPFLTELMERYLLMVAMIKQLGYTDIFAVPIPDSVNDRRAMFCVTSKGMDPLSFKEKAQESSDVLQVLGRVVNDVLALKFSNCAVDAWTRYIQLVNLQPFALLAQMINYELSDEEKKSGISLERLVQGIADVRKKMLGCADF